MLQHYFLCCLALPFFRNMNTFCDGYPVLTKTSLSSSGAVPDVMLVLSIHIICCFWLANFCTQWATTLLLGCVSIVTFIALLLLMCEMTTFQFLPQVSGDHWFMLQVAVCFPKLTASTSTAVVPGAHQVFFSANTDFHPG